MTGIIFDIRRYTIHDGPGIRTTVFFKGCPLHCRWCHNPESRSAGIETIMINKKMDGRNFEIPETVGRGVTVDALMDDIRQDRVFYEESGGGVTFSGGEPLMQYGFLTKALRQCRSENIHTAVDTCGYASAEALNAVLPFTDLFLYDIKHMDETEHQNYTGVSNEIILNNLKRLALENKKVIIRFPVIPGINDNKKNITAMKSFLNHAGIKNKHISLLPYHEAAKNKYKNFGIRFTANDIREPDENELQEIRKQLETAGFQVTIGA